MVATEEVIAEGAVPMETMVAAKAEVLRRVNKDKSMMHKFVQLLVELLTWGTDGGELNFQFKSSDNCWSHSLKAVKDFGVKIFDIKFKSTR
jgi:hypothetical protein